MQNEMKFHRGIYKNNFTLKDESLVPELSMFVQNLENFSTKLCVAMPTSKQLEQTCRKL